jgi:WD40 repeat protein
LFAVGFETGRLAIFNYKSGQIADVCPVSEEESPVTSIVAHSFEGLIFTGHQNGSIAIYDVKQQKVVTRTSLSGAVTSLSILNNGLHLVAGTT